MIEYLSIKNFALIKDLEINFLQGFNVFTGETGAGKTIILNALNLLLGSKYKQDMIRDKTKKLEITALFCNKEKQLIIKREFFEKGKSINKINDEIVSIERLKEIGDELVDMHGQHEHQSLLNPNKHLDILDFYGNFTKDKNLIAEMYKEIKGLEKDILEIESEQKSTQEMLDYYQFQLEEISNIDPKIEEEQDLENKRKIFLKVKDLFVFNEESKYLIKQMIDLAKQTKLNKITEIDDTFKPVQDDFEELTYNLENILDQLKAHFQKIDFSQTEMEFIEERLSNLKHLKRKFNTDIAGLIAKKEDLTLKIDNLEINQGKIINLKQKVVNISNKYQALATDLSNKRKKTAILMSQAIEKQLKDQAMEKASFQIKFSEKPNISENGLDIVEFLISPNPGQALKPLNKIASGGELSRISLAIKSVLTKSYDIETMIFDEIDAGIGGVTAIAVGEKLASLAKYNQIICITHLPQIASMADKHFLVEKEFQENNTEVIVKELLANDRKKEIARMLSGRNTEITMQHAEELLS